MAHSIEARVPFLDYHLIDFLFTLPDHWRINGIWTKYILRQAMKGILPELIRTRMDKIGFKASPSITFDYIKDNFASLVESRTDFEKQWLNQAGVDYLFRNILSSGGS
jgi:asparagine synthase (glutamine-hydrolysing)